MNFYYFKNIVDFVAINKFIIRWYFEQRKQSN